jgi:hypothetical protein
MHKLTTRAALMAAFCLAGGSIAAAQTQAPTKFYVDVNGGAQTQSESIELTNSFPLYGETAIINTAQGVDGGGLFDMSVGYRINRKFGVSLGVSIFSDTSDSSVAASIQARFLQQAGKRHGNGYRSQTQRSRHQPALLVLPPHYGQDRSRAVNRPGVLQREPGLHDLIGPDRHAEPDSRQHT